MLEMVMPPMTPTIPSITDIIAIELGDLDISLAVAGGIISIDVINNAPIILKDKATIRLINTIKSML